MISDEYQRLLAVNRFKHLSAGVKQDLDTIANLISQVCEAPVVLITIIDEKMQWFKASKGTNVYCNERDLSFCNVTINQADLLIVPDTHIDNRFNQLPVVIDEPHIRFYAGVSLITYDGHAVGTVCALDVVPRELNDVQQNTILTLAKQVLNILELNWSLHVLAQQHEEFRKQKFNIEQYAIKLNAIFNSSKDIHILLGRNMEVLAFNRAATKHIIDHYNLHLETGRSILDFVNVASARRLLVYFNSAFSGVNHHTEWQVMVGNQQRWFDVTFTAVRDEAGDIIGVSIDGADITENKRHSAQVNSQNAALQRIATFQSHELRRPVASLMGIINLIKDEPELAPLAQHGYLNMMASAVDELDGKIRGIVKDAETTIYGKDTSAQL